MMLKERTEPLTAGTIRAMHDELKKRSAIYRDTLAVERSNEIMRLLGELGRKVDDVNRSVVRLEWMTPEEAAEYVRLSRYTILEACKRGEIRHSQMSGKTIRIRREAVDEWLESKELGRAVVARELMGG